MNWSYLRHMIDDMHNDEEFQAVHVRCDDGTIIQIVDLERSEDGRWILVETQKTKR